MKYFFILAVHLFSLSSIAIVDMRNANYSNDWIDLELPNSGYDLKVERTYNSRTLYNGIFGFGWCSDFETKLVPTPEGNLKLTECGAGQEIYFFPREFNKKEIEKTVAQIIKKLRESKKFDEKTLKKLEKQDLVENNEMRSKYAFEFKIAIPIKDGSRFYANGKEVENILFTKNYYTRSLVDGSSQRFSKEGVLTHVYDKNGNYLKIDYDKDLIRELSDNNGRKLNFKYYNNKKVKSISGPNNIEVTYKYEKLDDLVSVTNAWKNTYNYAYDELHNLTKATWPDGTFIQLAYDTKNDWVTSFTDREKCKEEYTYDESPSEPLMHYWSIVKKTCGKEVVNESKYEFWHKKKADGDNYLYRASTVINDNSTEVTYHEVFNRPISIRRNGELFNFEYFANGQVKEKSTKYAILNYEYNKENNKVSKVTALTTNENGKVLKKITTEFKYDKKGNLTWASNSIGQKVDMTYDTKGRIATIKDQAKKFVKIQYDEKTGRPAVVTRPGLGTIKVSYKPSGEIEKVNSNEGPSVAMQVASTFNNLLEIISPATAEIYN